MYSARRTNDGLAWNGKRTMGLFETDLETGNLEHLEANEQDTTAQTPTEMPDQEHIASKNPYTRDR